MARLGLIMAALVFAGTAAAQEHDHKPSAPGATAAPRAQSAPAPAPDAAAHQHHEGHAAPSPSDADLKSEPPAPADHAADAIFGADVMGPARAAERRAHGGEQVSMVLVNIAEFRAGSGHNGYRWDGEAWYGGDIHRFTLKSEGEGDSGSLEAAEVQTLYARAIGPYFNLQAGLRYDFEPGPSSTYATVGVEGLAPYWFEVDAALFVSNKGDALARFEAYYDMHITQRLVLQPRAELNLAAQDVPATGIGSGLSNAEIGVRLRYDIRREFAPYIGVSYERKAGDSAKFARAAGERVRNTSFVIGVTTWF